MIKAWLRWWLFDGVDIEAALTEKCYKAIHYKLCGDFMKLESLPQRVADLEAIMNGGRK